MLRKTNNFDVKVHSVIAQLAHVRLSGNTGAAHEMQDMWRDVRDKRFIGHSAVIIVRFALL